MSGVVIDFASAIARRQPRPAVSMSPPPVDPGTLSHAFTFWRGATGIRYVHTVYGLFDCPEIPNANVLLVRRHDSGRAEVINIGRVEQDAPSLNLAEVRQTAARLGANEVHVHLLAETAAERASIERDLSGADELAAGGLGAQKLSDCLHDHLLGYRYMFG